MKIFIVGLLIAAGYYCLLTASTDMALDQLQGIGQQYSQAANYADQSTNTDIALRP